MSISERAVAKKIGKGNAFFSAMKRKRPEQYEYIMSLEGSTLLQKYRKYEDLTTDVYASYCSIPYILADNGIAITHFSKFLAKQGVYKNENSYATHSYKTVGNHGFKAYNKQKKILLMFRKFMKEYDERASNTKEDN